jgi:hypothetical protein
MSDKIPLIRLDDSLLIDQGRTRDCYLHPGNPERVVKVPAGGTQKNHRSNIKELLGYQALMRDQIDLTGISHCYGFVSTSRGTGLECDCIRDDDGAVSRTIWDIVVNSDECDVAYIQSVTQDFCQMLTQRDTRLFDLNLKNIVLKRRKSGVYEPVTVDLKGRFDNQETIPVSSYVSFFAKRKMARRSRQLIERISDFREKRMQLRSEAVIQHG